MRKLELIKIKCFTQSRRHLATKPEILFELSPEVSTLASNSFVIDQLNNVKLFVIIIIIVMVVDN